MPVIFERIKMLCKREGISVSALEKKLGLSVSTITKWQVSSPKIDSIIPVAQYFNVSIDFLCGLTDAAEKYLETQNISMAVKELFDGIIKRNLNDNQAKSVARYVDFSFSFNEDGSEK